LPQQAQKGAGSRVSGGGPIIGVRFGRVPLLGRGALAAVSDW
jgi:hypothetical protein